MLSAGPVLPLPPSPSTPYQWRSGRPARTRHPVSALPAVSSALAGFTDGPRPRRLLRAVQSRPDPDPDPGPAPRQPPPLTQRRRAVPAAVPGAGAGAGGSGPARLAAPAAWLRPATGVSPPPLPARRAAHAEPERNGAGRNRPPFPGQRGLGPGGTGCLSAKGEVRSDTQRQRPAVEVGGGGRWRTVPSGRAPQGFQGQSP